MPRTRFSLEVQAEAMRLSAADQWQLRGTHSPICGALWLTVEARHNALPEPQVRVVMHYRPRRNRSNL